MQPIFIALIAIVVVLVVGGILFAAFGQRLKGRLVLTITNQAYNPGDVMEGVMVVSSKKDLGPGRLYAALICNEEWYEWETDANGQRSREKQSQEVYRYEVDIDPHYSTGAGQEQTMVFSLPTPIERTVDEPGQFDDSRSGWLGTLGNIIESLGSRSSEYKWKVEGRYDIKGLDLTDSESISFNYNFR